jgi:hypothetical protein
VLALSRTLRAGALRRCRDVASWTALARGATRQAGWDVGMAAAVEPRDGRGLCCLRHVMIEVEQHLPPQKDAGNPQQPVGDGA